MFCYPQITNQWDLWKVKYLGLSPLTTTKWREIWQQYCTSVHVKTIDQSKHDTRIVSFGCITDMPQDSAPLPPSPAPYLTCFTPGRAWNNFPAGAGQTYFCSDTTCFWPDICLSSRIIWLHFTVKYMRTIKDTFQHYTRSPEFAVTTL